MTGRARLVLSVVAVLAAACGGSGGESTPTGPTEPERIPPPEVLQLGREVYEDTCSVCHGRRGEGDIAPALVDSRSEFTLSEHTDRVRNGRGAMPAFSGTLDDDEIRAVVAFERHGWHLVDEP